MIENLVEKLKFFDLTGGEARVYLALIKGNSTKSDIIKSSDVSSSIVYKILEKLINKGLASFSVIDNKKHYQATSPERLLDIIKTKEEEIKRLGKIGKDLIPALQRREDILFTNVYRGLDGFKALLNEVERQIEANGVKEWLATGVTSCKKESFNRLWGRWHKNVRPKYGVKAKFIFSEKGTKHFKTLKSAPLSKVKYLPSPSLGCITATGDMLIIMKYTEPSYFILIKNEYIADSFKKLFNVLWKNALT